MSVHWVACGTKGLSWVVFAAVFQAIFSSPGSLRLFKAVADLGEGPGGPLFWQKKYLSIYSGTNRG